MSENLDILLKEIRKCHICERHLPLGPNPVVRAKSTAKIVIIGQAPGTKVHQTGIPWNDPSGDKLREWLQLDREIFYDENKIAIIPMGFCYPGKGKSGDLPPRPECAPEWHERLFQQLPNLEMILLAGSYAINYYLKSKGRTLAETVRNYEQYISQGYWPLVHPSPRNRLWLKQNPWFEKDYIPGLQKAVHQKL
jgi:uracil-DNA glycosylase